MWHGSLYFRKFCSDFCVDLCLRTIEISQSCQCPNWDVEVVSIDNSEVVSRPVNAKGSCPKHGLLLQMLGKCQDFVVAMSGIADMEKTDLLWNHFVWAAFTDLVDTVKCVQGLANISCWCK